MRVFLLYSSSILKSKFRWPILAIVLACVQLFAASQIHAAPQALGTVSWRAERVAIERQFGADIQEIADWCRSNGIPNQVEHTFNIYVNRDLGRQYIFMPDTRSMPAAPPNIPDIHKKWLQKVNDAKIRHADRIFELAKRASREKAGTVAFQYLHDVLHYNRDHETVRKILGHRKVQNGWKVASDSVRVRPGKRDHDIVKWKAGTYITVLTPHFEIESNASEKKTRYLAEKLERWHDVWRQVFFEYWSSPQAVDNWINGKGSLKTPKKRFRVVFCKDRAEYLRQLEPLVRGVKVSTGYYSSDQRASFFYDGDEQVQNTWRHELTHQLFRESGGAAGDNLEAQFIWLDEGIATYFESLTDFGGYVTLGGFDASRIQYARIRRFLENFHIPLQELSAIGRSGLQKRPDIVRIYSEAAGMTDMLMNANNGAYESKLTEFFKLVYKGRIKPGTFVKVIGKTYQQLDEEYKEHLLVNSESVENLIAKPELLTELSVPKAELRTLAFEAIGECVNLTWLDLSKNSISLKQLTKLHRCQKINQLILTDCSFEPNSLRGLELFRNLDDLDLSGSNVRDSQLVSFQNLKALESLRLTATSITDQGLIQLASAPRLREIDVSRTQVTAAGVAALKARRPNITINQ